MPGGFCMDRCCDGEPPTDCELWVCVTVCDGQPLRRFDWAIETDPGGTPVSSGSASISEAATCFQLPHPADGDYTLTISVPFGFDPETVSFTMDCEGAPGALYVNVALDEVNEDVCGDCPECWGYYPEIPECITLSTPLGSPTMTLVSHSDDAASWVGCASGTEWSYKECTENTAEGTCYQWGEWTVPVIFEVNITRSNGGCLTMSVTATWALTCKLVGILGYLECEEDSDGYDSGYCGGDTDECGDRLLFGSGDRLLGHCNNSLSLVAMSCARWMYLNEGGTPVSAACIGGAYIISYTTRASGTSVSLDCTSETPFDISIDIDTDIWTGDECLCDWSMPAITETYSDPVVALLGSPCTVTVAAC